MKYDYGKVAGGFLFVGAVQFVLGLITAEALYPGYSVSENYISDLGVGATSLLFNSSVFLLGVTIIAGAYFAKRALDFRLLYFLLVLTGIGAMGVGLFPKDAGVIHSIAALIAFTFGALSAITSYKLQKPPLSFFAVLLGALSLAALALFISDNYLGLGKGGMERIIVYPITLWAIAFSGHLISSS
jgi:hypothetical membrane protein